MNTLLMTLALVTAQSPAQTGPPPARQDWVTSESKHLTNIRQVTDGFVRAGEGYFSPDGKQVIFQAEERDTGNPFYQIFVLDLESGKYRRISPGVGRTTCGYFRPDGKKVIFASSHSDPEAKLRQQEELVRRAEDARKGIRRRYSWDFDPHMKIYEADPDGGNLKCLTPDARVYTAEGSYSADGQRIVYAAGTAGDTNLFVMNADGSGVRQITSGKPPSYNGGPFFSPDGTRIVFRADRREKDRLQLYVINADGTGEKALTRDDKWVYWAPYWYKDGKHIIFTAADHSNELARPNYDLYWMNIDSGKTTRLTYAPGQDVLPVFSPDYKKVMWTSNRDGRGPTQLYIADFTPPRE